MIKTIRAALCAALALSASAAMAETKVTVT
ncbi:hypothetical protein jaqu_23630 [Jannaschia aquimarina]|uniref:Uncharacterized protein n=1 Tax=Jannaschia aquimarina TaxID=935700 RepID=A0A0D1EGQ0_9RHOB|nr:hypothetical protein jaqu_23630 [Jannaschia aquimarina]SNT02149.1 hypothetical protein SAMN05421775_104274 [Jannaschia aquimarina]